MKNITLILNATLMAVFGFASAVVMDPLYNRAIEFPTEPFISHSLPPMSALLLGNLWITWATPAIWAILTLWMIMKKRTSADYTALHTSITLLAGITMLLIFALAGGLPFIGYIAHLKQ